MRSPEQIIQQLDHFMALPGLAPREMHLLRKMRHAFSMGQQRQMDVAEAPEIATLLQKCQDLSNVSSS